MKLKKKNMVFYSVPFILIFIYTIQWWIFTDDINDLTLKFIKFITIIDYILIIISYYRCSLSKDFTKHRYYNNTFINSRLICDKCNLYLKPMRTHHCSACKSCNLKMDHHCPFMNNCVTFTNHKLYVLFIFYCFILLLIFTFLFFNKLYFNYDTLWEGETTRVVILRIFFYFLTFCIMIGCYIPCLNLLFYHIVLSFKNSTTLEDLKGKFNVYDFGNYYNFRRFYGNFFEALLPFKYNNKYEGYYFPKKNSNKYLNIKFEKKKIPEINIEKILEEKLEDYDNIRFIYN